MKKLEFAKVQEGENKLAIEVSNDSPVVAIISQNGMLECILVNDSFPEVLSDICGHISSELGVAAVAVDTGQYGDDVTPIVVDSDRVKVKMVGVGSAQAYAVLSTPNICMKSQIIEV